MSAKRTDPSIPITDKRFVPTRGADVQATWRQHGWLPPSEYKPAPVFVEKAKEWDQPMRRVK